MWDNIIVNDPDDDYNLVVELWYNKKNYGIVKWSQSEEKYNLIIYPNKNGLVIPCDVLKDIFDGLDGFESTRNI